MINAVVLKSRVEKIVKKLLANPFGLCLFLKAIMPYTAEQQLVNLGFVLLFC